MEKTHNPFIPEFVKIERVTKETSDTSTIRVKYSKPYSPGQFVQLSIFGMGECPISICSYNTEYMELCIRNVGSLTKAILDLKVGDKIGIRGPYGTPYPMKDFFGKNLIIVGGGTGVAALRGVIQYAEDSPDSFNDVSIFLGYRNPEQILFTHDLERWKRSFNLMLTVDAADKKWKGNVGLITAALEKAKLNKDNSVVFLCGPPIMIKFVIELLLKIGFEERQLWVSLERHMKCGIGKCGRCMVMGKYICEDGPVFNYFDAKNLID